MSKHKIVNDPVHGFIHIPSNIIFELIEHPFFQRLRRIQQLGLTSFVYPGASHNRLQHALGSLFLMQSAIEVLRMKGHNISEKESEAAQIAILLHDIGHGPFSHTLENSIIGDLKHEDISLLFMEELNMQYNGALQTAIKIFKNEYHKKFLHQLVSSQLDMDRLDYLKRDSFYTGVNEGVIGSERIIKMLDVVNDQLVVENKGIYSIEKFLIARRLMYWQVYLHKTVLAAEYLMINILKRAKELTDAGNKIFSTPSLAYFLLNTITKDYVFEEHQVGKRREEVLSHFAALDDYDVVAAIKIWINDKDPVLSRLCKAFTERHLFRVVLQNEKIDQDIITKARKKIGATYKINDAQAGYFVFSGAISNKAYNENDEKIKILYKNGDLKDITEASDMLNVTVLTKAIKKYFFCYPKEL